MINKVVLLTAAITLLMVSIVKAGDDYAPWRGDVTYEMNFMHAKILYQESQVKMLTALQKANTNRIHSINAQLMAVVTKDESYLKDMQKADKLVDKIMSSELENIMRELRERRAYLDKCEAEFDKHFGTVGIRDD